MLGAAAIVVLVAAVTVIGVRAGLRRALETQFTAELERQTRLVAAAIPPGTPNPNEVAHRLGSLLGRRLTLVDTTGRVVADSDFDDVSVRLLDNHLMRPEVQEALANGLGVAHRLSTTTNRFETKVAVPSWPGVVRLSATQNQVDRLLRRAMNGAFLAGLTAMLFGITLAAFASASISRPIREMARAGRALSTGRHPHHPVSSTSEVRDLVRSMRSMHQDLSARINELEGERAETSTILEVMVQGVLVTDERGAVTICNRAMRSLLGFEEGQRIPDVTELFYQREARDIVERALDDETVPAAEVVIEGRTVLMTARPVPNGGIMLGLLDVTEVKRVQEVRRDFVANVSHELKTPLTSILGYSATLLQDKPDEDTTEKFLAAIHRNAARMQSLVDDLLGLARVESGAWKPDPQPVDIQATANEVWGAFTERAAKKHITLTIEDQAALWVLTDRSALQQVLTNLFDNALRHSHENGGITLRIKRLGARVELAVKDSGSGIPAEHLGRVFERFYRADPGRSRQEGGTGLGLSIVKHLIETQGGQITLDSELGRGTTVTIRLPDLKTEM
jgi:two-component system phosphate regulon sensor histidine kinase PhoR